MDLLIDIGNTSLKWARCEPDALSEMQSVLHHGHLPIDLYAAWEKLPAPARIRVSNVAGEELERALSVVCRSLWGCEPQFACSRADYSGLSIAYATPEQFGVDRWLALLGALRTGPGAHLIVDAGTAITYDLLAPDGNHLGGLILPGLRMAHEVLTQGTRMPGFEQVETDLLWAADTASAVAAGPVQAAAALAERLATALGKETGVAPHILLTGGDAERLMPAIEWRSIEVVPDLVLKGLLTWRG